MLLIIFLHSVNEYDFYSSETARYLLIPSYGTLGCSVFFFLSGYGMFQSLSCHVVDLKYLYLRLKKLFVPFLVAYILMLVWFMTADMSRDFKWWNVGFLNMPDGTSLWFFKTVIVNYIVASLLRKICRSDKCFVYAMLLLYMFLVLLMRIVFECPSYWYYSTLSFPLGMLLSFHKNVDTRVYMASIIVFAVYYLSLICGYHKTLLEIAGNLVFPVILIGSLNHIVGYGDYLVGKILIYIGKNSLLFYLLGIPVMQAINSAYMHWMIYFMLNLLFSYLVVYCYKWCSGKKAKSEVNRKV